MQFLNRICTALADKGVRYALVGGHAVALHGAVRGTVDVDIALAWNLKSLKATESALQEIGLVSRLPVTADNVFQFRDEYIQNRNLIGWNFYNPDNLTEQVDIVINYDLKGRKLKNIDTAAGKIRILGLPDLIKMKTASGRPQDMEDVKALEKLR
jgi:predicted nucleotidyltransferase